MKATDHLLQASERSALLEARYQAMFDQSPTGIYLLDPELRITDMNAGAETLIGEATATLGHTVSEILHQLWSCEDAEAALSLFRQVLVTGVPFRAQAYEVRRRGSDERLYFDWEIRQLMGRTGSLLGLLCTFVDVTSHVQARTSAAAAQAQLSVLTSIVPQLIWSTDAQGRMTYVNQRWIEYTGLDLAACQTTNWRELVHPDDYANVMKRWKIAFRKGEDYQIEFRSRRAADQTYRWFLIRAWPQWDQEGRVIAWHGTNTDIHELTLTTQALKRAQERWQFMANAMPQKIFTATPSGDVDYFNAQWMEYTGLSFKDIRDWGWTQFIHPDDLDGNLQSWRESLASGQPLVCEHRFRRADGVYRWHLCRAHAMRDANGAISMWLGSDTDIEDQKRIQANLGRSNADLEQFAAVASHDLKEPLRMVSSYLAIIERRYKSQIDDAGRGFLQAAIDGARRMHCLIDAIMSYSKVSRPGEVLEAVDANQVLEDTIALLESQITEARAVIHRDALPRVTVDPAQLGRVFQNLIGNALKFCRGRDPEIRICAIDASECAIVAIQDNGLGISDQQQEHVFEMFRRHHVQEEIPGTGIGLASCRKIIENHGGAIWLESQVGVGTTFFFSLPKSAQVTDPPSASDPERKPSSAPPSQDDMDHGHA